MDNVKERLPGTITVLDKTSAVCLWDSIEEVEPDEIDLKMIQEIQSDPDCHTFE